MEKRSHRKLVALVLFALMLAVVGAVVAARWSRPTRSTLPPALTESRSLVAQAVPLAPHVYLLGKSWPSAVYAVTTSDGLVLVDSGLEADAAALLSQLAELQLDVSGLKAILLTHVHGDHSQGAARLRELTGAKIYAGRGDCKPLREGGPREAFFSLFYRPDVTLHKTTVDVELVGGETIEVGDTRFDVIAAPGHTPGSTCYLMQRPGLRALFAGDIILSLNPGRKYPGALGTYSAYFPPRYGGNARHFLSTLRNLRALPLPDLVLPGHPSEDTVAQNPRMTQEGWYALLDPGIREMVQLRARYETDGADFLDGNPKELLPGLHYLGDFAGAAVYCLDTPKGLFLFDAPGGPSLVDFLSTRFKELGWQGRQPLAVVLTSADPAATAGLEALARSTGCKVVAPTAGVEEVRRICPAETEVLNEEAIKEHGWFEMRAIPLRGRGVAPQAYEIRWAGKAVLASGRMPMPFSFESLPGLQGERTGEAGSPLECLKSLDELAKLKPNVWLPAVPAHGRNANLYDNDWDDILHWNLHWYRQAIEAP
jgi:glyoxylase-like metal-dependent hydrolase (beta-lactamase superfamily II)